MIVEEIMKWIQNNSLFDKINNNNKVLPATAITGTTLVIYLGIVRYLRYRNLKTIIKRYPNSNDILEDAEAAQDVFSITMKLEFPYLATLGTELALFKTFTIPTISKILASTGEFGKNVHRRSEDTGLIINEIVDTYARIQKQLNIDPDTPRKDIKEQWERPKEAVKRLNEIHGHYNILNDDYIYTLSLFIFEPIYWVNKYDWRQLDQREKNALFRVWYDVGVAMNIKDIPDTLEKMYEFKKNYAKEKIIYSPSNWKCGEPTVRLLISNLPSFLREIGYKISLRLLPSILDPMDVKGFQLPHPESKLITFIVKSVFHTRAFIIRYAMLPRSSFINRTPFYSNNEKKFVPVFFRYKPYVYKNGYTISNLGPEKMLKEAKCPFNK